MSEQFLRDIGSPDGSGSQLGSPPSAGPANRGEAGGIGRSVSARAAKRVDWWRPACTRGWQAWEDNQTTRSRSKKHTHRPWGIVRMLTSEDRPAASEASWLGKFGGMPGSQGSGPGSVA